MEAQILDVKATDDQVVVQVVYRDRGSEIHRELSFASQDITADLVRERVKNIGTVLMQIASNGENAKVLIGEIIPVELTISLPSEVVPENII